MGLWITQAGVGNDLYFEQTKLEITFANRIQTRYLASFALCRTNIALIPMMNSCVRKIHNTSLAWG